VSVRRGRTRPTSPVDDGAAGENRPLTWGPFGDHTLYAMVNDLRVCARLARPHFGHTRPATRGYGLARFTGGQVVAGSNPASPTFVSPTMLALGPTHVMSQDIGIALNSSSHTQLRDRHTPTFSRSK
jgi:hypothetical protein